MLPKFTQWHVVTQDRMFTHLKSLWREDVPRVMIDAGCHAGHGRHKNVSDALLWLDSFHYPGSEVLAIDAFEDFALDLQYRFDHHPQYASYTRVKKRAIALALYPLTGIMKDFTKMARMHITCCADKWCNHKSLERRYSDHLCKMTRMRLGIIPSDGRDKYTNHPNNLSLQILNGQKNTRYNVETRSLDDIWKSLLSNKHVDFLKIDIDSPWHSFGFNKLLKKGAVSVVVFEVDREWRRPTKHKLGDLDELISLAHNQSYHTFVKVPCKARNKLTGSMESGQYMRATRLILIANVSKPFTPTHFWASNNNNIQDFVLIKDTLMKSGTVDNLKSLADRMETDCKRKML